MDDAIARGIAHLSHVGQLDRFGEPLIEHIERVAAAVAPDARAVAFLHDVLEHSDTSVSELSAQGLTPVELGALRLLTRGPGESYEAHALRIVHAPGREGALARAIKVADLDDHLEHREMPPGAPPYAWARRLIAAARASRDGDHGAAAA